jgi:hypothetical protein
MCGGDGRIGNALGGSSATCHDVTKTKPEHHRPVVAAPPTGPRGPVTPEGLQLAQEVNASTVLASEAKARLVAEIANHESTHERCTKTFIKKVRKQTRPAV